MNLIATPSDIIVWAILLAVSTKIYSQPTTPITETKMETIKTSDASPQIFIDRFFVPLTSKPAFLERMAINRNFIKTLPGFIEDTVYERLDDQGNLIVVTVAAWANEEAIKKAKEAVQAFYKKEAFDMQGFLKGLNITIDRGVYKKVGEP